MFSREPKIEVGPLRLYSWKAGHCRILSIHLGLRFEMTIRLWDRAAA